MKYISLAVLALLSSKVTCINKKDATNVQIPVPRTSQEFEAQLKLTDAEKEDNFAKKSSKKSKLTQHGDSSDEEKEKKEKKGDHSDDDDHHDEKKEKKFVPAELDDKGNPEIEFKKDYDHVTYKPMAVGMDASAIGFKLTKKSVGHYCDVDDWLVLRYKMWSQEDGTLLEDTDAATESKEPVIALVGRYQLPKCLDIAVQKMKTGEEATVKCPNYLDLGGQIKNGW